MLRVGVSYDGPGGRVEVAREVATVEAAGEFLESVRDLQAPDGHPDEPVADGAEIGPAPPRPSTAETERPWGVIDVGDVEGRRGEEVSVPILGHTDTPTDGFSLAIGYESRALEFAGVDWGEFLVAHTGPATLKIAEDRPRGHRAAGNAGANVLLSYMFFGLAGPPTEVVLADGTRNHVLGQAEPIILPPQTELATVRFRIRDVALEKKWPLLNWSLKFGKPRVRNFFTNKDVRGGIPTDLEDGSVTVLASS